MSKVQQKISEIEEQKIGATSKRVLLVEGVDDIAVASSFLFKKYPDSLSDWVIADAGNKRQVLAILKKRPSWLGMVDRDEWDQTTVQQQERDHPNLWVLPRFCIENYFILPDELWAAFPVNQQTKLVGGKAKLQQRLIAPLEQWVAHGVLWSVINPLWDGLRAKGFKEALLAPEVALNEETIKKTLQQWHDYLEPQALWNMYQQKLQEVKHLSVEEQMKHCIHGKHFYTTVVHPVLDQLLGQKSSKMRKQAIIRTRQVPEDWNGLWDRMGLSDG